MTEQQDPALPAAPMRETFASTDGRAPTQGLGIETRAQKAALEAALFGDATTPVEIAHYTVIGTLGAGGMGVVYVAHDRQLDRRVALKLLRHPSAGGVAQARLLREAQAMARLAHPNVVTVHEVGTHERQVFVAMEFVGGSNLRGWLQMQRRPWEDILAMFLQAGEGLAAAHEAGIIHRDFKPDNVLVGDDGRVRVADFGLAHGLSHDVDTPTPTPPHAGASSSTVSGVSLDAPLTETGTLLGTPAYMAPEQHTRARVDERCDQFAFCIALWEAFYGKRPFPGSTLPQLVDSLMERRIETPSELHGVPPWLHAVLLRGLEFDPDARWASIREMLAALTRDPERIRRRRRRAATLAAVTLGLITTLGARAASEQRNNDRQRYWNALTEGLLEMERSRGLAQATDDARRARNATRMSGYKRYRPKAGAVDREDPTLAAALLREIEGEARNTDAWISAANEVLGQPLSYAVLRGHRNLIVDVNFSPDGAAVYTASSDGEVWRWETATGAGRPIIRHEREVTSLAVSRDGHAVASASKDGRARLWSDDAPGQSRVIAEHDAGLNVVAFDPSGHTLASAANDGSLRLTDTQTGDSRLIQAHEGPIYALTFAPGGRRVLSAGADRRARLWRVDDGRRVANFVGHAAAVYHARFIDGEHIVTGSDDGTMRLWEIAAPGTGTVLAAHDGEVTALDVCERRVASAGSDERIQVVNLDDSEPVTLDAPGQVWSLRFIADGDELVTASWDGTARLWSSQGGVALRTFVGHREPILRVGVDPGGRWLATASYDLDVRLWDLGRELSWTSLSGHSKQIAALAFDPDSATLATGSSDGSVRLWDTTSARSEAVLATMGPVYSLDFSPDSTHLAAATGSGAVQLWALDGRRQRTLSGHQREVWQVAFDDSSTRLASASLDGTVRVWDVAEGKELLALESPGHVVTAVAFEPGSRRLISATDDGTLELWDATTGELSARLPGHSGKIWQLVRSPDGRTLATASDDGTARLWPDDDSSHAIVLAGHRQPVWSVAFDADGDRLITASFDHDARIWRVEDGALLRTLTGHSETVWAASFTPDGRAVTASDDNTLRVWPLDLDATVIVLSAHTDAVTKLAVDTRGLLLASGSMDASVKLWDLDRLETDVAVLDTRLRDATTWCLDLGLRMRELGEDRIQAERAVGECEARYGRN